MEQLTGRYSFVIDFVEILIDCYCVCLQVFENRNKFAYLEDEDEVGSEGQDD